MDTLADRYAHFIIHSMLRLEDGEKLTIHADDQTIAFAHKVTHEAADTSGVPVALVYIENGRVESVDEIAPEFAQKDAPSCHLHSPSVRQGCRDGCREPPEASAACRPDLP